MMTQADPSSHALTAWLGAFEAALAAPARADWSALFGEECYWRDLVAFTWSIETMEGREAILHLARQQAPLIGANRFALDDPTLPMTDETQGWFTFETEHARCRGHIQLRDGRCYVLLTAMVELKNHEEIGGPRRPAGIEHRAEKGRRTWLDNHEHEQRTLGISDQPYCLIVGGGQNGLALAARLRRLQVPTLVIDALEKPGDCWRVRYRSLYLHDPVFLDHFPYMPFPDHWPLYTSKDKMGDWLEIYARVMEIVFWGSTRCKRATYDEASGTWTVTVEREGREITLKPQQLVLATGLSGAKYIPAIPGANLFAGAQYHAADHRGGDDMAGTRAIVVGSNNSAHDICVDLWENDAQVTMIQRSPTIVVRASTMAEGAKGLAYADPKMDTEFADLMGATVPFRPRTTSEKAFTDYLRQIDAPFYERLEKSGFLLGHGEDETGFFMAYYRRAAGYYIDVGASDLIANGSIAVQVGEIGEITPDGMRMADGTFIPADLIVYATGYHPMNHWMRELISPEVERKVGRCWGLGSGTDGDPGPWEGELRNMWKPTAQNGLWFQGGNLMQSRFHSLHLALQIKARHVGLPTPVWRVGEHVDERVGQMVC